MSSLLDVDRVLALFAEGIAGRPYHIKSASELGQADTAADGASASHDGRSLYLPDAIEYFEDDRLNEAIYRLTVLDQLGFREFGTYRFDIDVARRRIPALATLERDDDRQSDLGMFFLSFAKPELARRLFRIIETTRIQAAVERRYPGVRKYRRALRDRLGRSPSAGVWFSDSAAFTAETILRQREAAMPEADVYTSAAGTVACYDALDDTTESPERFDDEAGHSLEMLQREARLEDWQEELDAKEGEVAAMEFAEQAGEAIKVGEANEAGGEIRDTGAALIAERDRLKRRIDIERSTVRRALGEAREGTLSFRYDEWDYHQGAYLRGWCRLYEERLHAAEDVDSQALLDAVRPFAKAVRQRFEQVRPGGYLRVKKTPDGDELDLDAIIETRADIRTGASPDERVYSRRERLRRDVAAAFLVDLSASTDDIVPEERDQEVACASRVQDIRDPYFDEDDDYDFQARMAAEAGKRRVINIQREAVLLMATALEGLGDRYAVYGFSGYGRDGVEFYVAKEFDEPFDQYALDAIAAMKPKRSTRMGPAIRHAVTKLEASGSALKVLMIVSDGFPQDHDYGPDRGKHEYGVQDTAKALREAEGRGVETFCVTVDCSPKQHAPLASSLPRSPVEGSHDYLRRMCPDHRYMVIEETNALPEALQKAYRQLTRV